MEFVKLACSILKENISEIGTVSEWADELGYSKNFFSRKIKKEGGVIAKQLLVEARVNKLEKILEHDPDIKAIALAKEISLPNTQSLYQYLRVHCNCTISEFREKVRDRND